jgi:sigma-B regulation protein RsbU (phosphoserine phosphatase)
MQAFFRRIVAYMLDQYGTVLFILAATSSISYLVFIYDLQNQEGNATLVKLSTEQSQIVQSVNFYTMQFALSTSRVTTLEAQGKITKSLAQLQDTHESLKAGDRFVRDTQGIIRVRGRLPDDLREIYFAGKQPIDTLLRNYHLAVRRILTESPEQLRRNSQPLLELYNQLSPPLLVGLSKASTYYQKQTETMLSQTKSTQNIVFAINLGILALLGTALLRPLVFRLKESNLKVASEKAFADNVINTAQAIIIGLDRSSNIVLFNRYAEENTGWAQEEVMRQNFFTRFIPDSEQNTLEELFIAMMSGRVEFADELETQMRVSTGELINVIWHTTTILDAQTEQPIMFLATGVDITERKRAESNLQRAHAELAVLSSRLQSEVNLAATLQRSILPEPVIELPGIQGQAMLLTSSEVGGDYYDYYKISAYQSVLLIGDVSGHGVAAGTMVSAAKAGVYPLIHEGISNPSEILRLLNETLLATAQQSLLMTMACVSLDARDGTLLFANAGHVLPYLWRHNQQHWEMLEASGLPLGKSMEADYLTSAVEIKLDVGDRLFLFTDGLVEEESPTGEAFGYERLEEILSHCGEIDAEELKEYLLQALAFHCETEAFSDDVTIMVFSHSDRVSQEIASDEAADVSDIIRVSDGFYRQGDHPIPRISREYVVFIAEREFADLLSRFSQDGICRILPKYNEFCKKIGWNLLLSQHHDTPTDDLYALMPHLPQHRQFNLSHTDDKLFIMEEILSWLHDQGGVSQEHLDALMVILDEMTENSLYAAPRDGKGVPYYQKGESRELSEHEEVRINVALSNNRLGLMITDNWGTLPPSVFLRNLAHAMDEGVEAGVGGAGLYMMWRLADYFQIRVHPQHRTQVTTLWDLSKAVEMDINSGFQFIHHSEYEARV